MPTSEPGAHTPASPSGSCRPPSAPITGIYWFTRTATSAADAVYAQYGALFADPSSFADSGVPTAVVAFAEDVPIRRFAEQGNTIVRWTDVDDGGHFAALEQPDALVADLRAFITGLRE